MTATQTGTNCCAGANKPDYALLPVTLQRGQSMAIEVGMGTAANPMDIFTRPGYYTFSFGIGVDCMAPVFAATSPATLLDTAARQWTGAACMTAAMQAQIPPATNPPTYYICPDS